MPDWESFPRNIFSLLPSCSTVSTWFWPAGEHPHTETACLHLTHIKQQAYAPGTFIELQQRPILLKIKIRLLRRQLAITCHSGESELYCICCEPTPPTCSITACRTSSQTYLSSLFPKVSLAWGDKMSSPGTLQMWGLMLCLFLLSKVICYS